MPEGRASITQPYVALRWPDGHVLFRMMFDGGTESEEMYEQIRLRVIDSIREALDTMGVEVIEEGEEAING